MTAISENIGGEINTQTDTNGFYTMDLTTGTYDITVSKDNYSFQTINGVLVLDNQTTVQDFTILFLGSWVLLDPNMCEDFTRFDAEYSADTGKVYFLGGRSGTATIGDIYYYDA